MKIVRIILLFPFTFIYWTAVSVRNFLYDTQIFKSTQFDIPIIGVGNLSVGGTGKTPHVEYLINLLIKEDYNPALLSRGYQRKTKGYLLANENSTAKEIGDEPFQIKQRFPNIKVVVCEKRVDGVRKIIENYPEVNVIILDDSFQHRAIKAGLNILITEYSNPFIDDSIIPLGRLREGKNSYKRADVVIVSKSPDSISESQIRDLRDSINPFPNQELFFSYIEYLKFKPFGNEEIIIHDDYSAMAFSGIANSKPFKSYLDEMFDELWFLKFSDHHKYTVKDIKLIIKNFNNIENSQKILVTTEKDISRIKNSELEKLFKTLPLYFVPIEVKFLNTENISFDNKILSYVGKDQRNN